MSSRKPYLSGVLRPHDNHSALLPHGRSVFSTRRRFVGDFQRSHFSLFGGAADADDLHQVWMFVGQVENEVLDLRKRMVRRMEVRSRERRIPTRYIGRLTGLRVEDREVFEW